jgi:hypothetical protein
MRPIGFSTGALALGDFESALQMLRGRPIAVVELSALREPELAPLAMRAPDLNLEQFQYVAVHAPSRIEPGHEAAIVEQLRGLAAHNWPVVVHPDAIRDWALWRSLGAVLLVENMDRRKPRGRTVDDLQAVFEHVPEAGFCFDVGHARQCDSSMTEAYLILKRFGEKLRQVHLSEVTTRSTHDRLSYASILATREVASLIPEHIPIVLETPVTAEQIEQEIHDARSALASASSGTAAGVGDLARARQGPCALARSRRAPDDTAAG